MVRVYSIPYGAFELKCRYQRNMLTGTITAALLAVALIGIVWIFGNASVVETDSGGGIIRRDSTVIVIVRPRPPDVPSIGGRKGPAPPSPPSLNGSIVPVDDLPAEEDTVDFWNIHKGRSDPYDTGMEYGDGGEPGSGGNYGGPEVIPPVEEFIPVEIQPVLIHEQKAVYPKLALAAGFEASVYMNVFVNREGRVIEARAARCTRPGMGFEEAALEAAYQYTYKPAIQNGESVGVWVSYRVDFILDGSR